MPNDFENEFNNAVKEAAKEEYRRVRKGLLNASQDEAAEILGYNLRQYQRYENGEGGRPDIAKHFFNMFTLLKHYALGTAKVSRSQDGQLLKAEGNADEYAEKEARQIVSRLVSSKWRGVDDDKK